MATQKKLAALLSYNMKWEYLEMCGFVKAMMSLAIVISNSLLICSPRDKDACIHQKPDLTDGGVMELLVSWRG